MATATEIGLQVARRVRDATQSELTAAGYLDFINMAIDDLKLEGWLEPQAEDTSLSVLAGTYTYTIPDGFAYIRRLEQADSDGSYPMDSIIPAHYWFIENDAQINIRPDYHAGLVTGRTIKIVGQKRPSGGVLGSATIVAGMESFVRERAVTYVAEYLASGDSALAGFRQRLAEGNWPKSQQLLARHPQEFRVKPSSVHVPGR